MSWWWRIRWCTAAGHHPRLPSAAASVAAGTHNRCGRRRRRWGEGFAAPAAAPRRGLRRGADAGACTSFCAARFFEEDPTHYKGMAAPLLRHLILTRQPPPPPPLPLPRRGGSRAVRAGRHKRLPSAISAVATVTAITTARAARPWQRPPADLRLECGLRAVAGDSGEGAKALQRRQRRRCLKNQGIMIVKACILPTQSLCSHHAGEPRITVYKHDPLAGLASRSSPESYWQPAGPAPAPESEGLLALTWQPVAGAAAPDALRRLTLERLGDSESR